MILVYFLILVNGGCGFIGSNFIIERVKQNKGR